MYVCMYLSIQILICSSFFSALKCVCHLCVNHTCETEAEGACWNSVMLINGKEEAVKSCLSPSELKGQVFCYSSRNVSKRNCCFTDFCNNETLHLNPGMTDHLHLILKGVIGCKIHFTSCLNINVCWKCVHIHHLMIKIHPVVFFKSLF